MIQNAYIDGFPNSYTYELFSKGKDGTNINVKGLLPQEWLVSVGSTWEGNAAGDTLQDFGNNAGGATGLASSAVVTLGGGNLGFTALANRQWTGGRPIVFNLLAEFNAYENALEEVMRPALLLQSMAMPTTLGNLGVGNVSAGNVISAPYFDDAGTSGTVGGSSTLLLRIGEMFIFRDIIVEDVNLTNHMKLTAEGLPIKITAEIQVATRGPVTFEQYVSYMTGDAMRGLFDKNDVIQAARKAGPGSGAGLSNMETTAATR